MFLNHHHHLLINPYTTILILYTTIYGTHTFTLIWIWSSVCSYDSLLKKGIFWSVFMHFVIYAIPLPFAQTGYILVVFAKLRLAHLTAKQRSALCLPHRAPLYCSAVQCWCSVMWTLYTAAWPRKHIPWCSGCSVYINANESLLNLSQGFSLFHTPCILAVVDCSL